MSRPDRHRLVAALTGLLMVLGAALPTAGHACAGGHGDPMAACCHEAYAAVPAAACAQHADCVLSSEDPASSAVYANVPPTPTTGAGVLAVSFGGGLPQLAVRAVIPAQHVAAVSSVALHLLNAVFLN